jgi:glycine oxidase
MSDVVVIGAGAIGTACAWRCAQRGLSVTLVDPDPTRGAWNTAAGMLAPVTELQHTDSALLWLNLASLERYPAYVTELMEATGLPTGYLECGTLEVAWDGADLHALRDLHAFGVSLGLASRMLTGRELREAEPALAPGLPGGLLAEFDHQVDPRLLHAAQLRAALDVGVTLHAATARIDTRDGRAHGVTLGDGTTLCAGTVVLAAGAWSAQLDAVAVRPVKGQTLRLRLPGGMRLARIVRAVVKGNQVYVVPRSDGRVLVGASSEEAGFDVSPRAGAVYELLRDAQSVLPELSEAVLDEVSTGLRPGSPDNAPVIGPSAIEGLVHATGHYRNGILLTPVTADAVATFIADGTLLDVVAPFGASRFVSDACGANTVSDACGANTVSDACGANTVSDACGANTVSDACGANHVGDAPQARSDRRPAPWGGKEVRVGDAPQARSDRRPAPRAGKEIR